MNSYIFRIIIVVTSFMLFHFLSVGIGLSPIQTLGYVGCWVAFCILCLVRISEHESIYGNYDEIDLEWIGRIFWTEVRRLWYTVLEQIWNGVYLFFTWTTKILLLLARLLDYAAMVFIYELFKGHEEDAKRIWFLMMWVIQVVAFYLTISMHMVPWWYIIFPVVMYPPLLVWHIANYTDFYIRMVRLMWWLLKKSLKCFLRSVMFFFKSVRFLCGWIKLLNRLKTKIKVKVYECFFKKWRISSIYIVIAVFGIFEPEKLPAGLKMKRILFFTLMFAIIYFLILYTMLSIVEYSCFYIGDVVLHTLGWPENNCIHELFMKRDVWLPIAVPWQILLLVFIRCLIISYKNVIDTEIEKIDYERWWKKRQEEIEKMMK